MANRVWQRVRITGGMSEFIGRTGKIVDDSDRDGRTTLYRVRLDEPVEIPHVGLVSDDLWPGSMLKKVRS
jgi:hypothetical protein